MEETSPMSPENYLKEIGFMPDDFHVQEMMTVEEFLHFYGTLRKVKRERANEVMELVGLDDKKRELVKSLSKGMRQRLLLGHSILAQPSLFCYLMNRRMDWIPTGSTDLLKS